MQTEDKRALGLDGVRVLIVEDEHLISLGMSFMLTEMGMRVAGVVDTGEAAIRLVREIRPDVVLMDIVLKGPMDGITAAEHIQIETGTPMIFLSGNLDQENMRRIEPLSHFGCLSKPVDRRSLELSIKLASSKVPPR